MKKIFLYLYSIKEYQTQLMFSDNYYMTHDLENPMLVLNECIKRRYKDNGYEVVLANYPDKEIYGISEINIDRIINTDITFKEASGYREDGSEKPIEEVKYPSEQYLLEQVGNVDEIIIGGFHSEDCVKRVAEHFYKNGINTMIDMELTGCLFYLYKLPYFKKECYNPANFKQYKIAVGLKYKESMEQIIEELEQYNLNIYKFNEYEPTISIEEVFNDIQIRKQRK